MFQGPSKPSWAGANQRHLGMEARGRRKTCKMKERGKKEQRMEDRREKGSPGKKQEEDKSEGEAWTDRATRRGWRKGSGSGREALAHPKEGVFTTQSCKSWSYWPSGAFFLSLSRPDSLHLASGT